MSLTQAAVSDSAPLMDLMGHSLAQCEVPKPGANNHDNWLTRMFSPVLKQTFRDHENNIVFVDLLFSRVETNEFFGGIVVQEKHSQGYKNLLKSLFDEYISVGSHPEFQGGLQDLSNDRYLYSSVDAVVEESANHASASNSPVFSAFYAEAAEYMPKVGETPVAVAEWITRVASKGVCEHWAAFIDRASIALPSLRHVFGVPITSPDASLKDKVFPVASLFIGLSGCDALRARAIARDLCPRLIAFALRTYGVMKAEQAARARQSERRARLLDAVQQDLTDLHRLAREIQAKASVIEGRVNPIAGGILRNRAEVKLLFDSKERDLFYSYNEDSGETCPACTRCTGLLTERPSVEGGSKIGEVRSVHGSSDCSDGNWSACESFFQRLGTHRNDLLLQFLGEPYDSKAGEDADAIARKRHASAKLLLHRVVNDEHKIFPLQVLLLGVLASRVRGSQGPLEVTWQESNTPVSKTRGWSELLALPDWLFDEAGGENVDVEEHQACALVTTGLWQLLAVELVGSTDRSRPVIADQCVVHWTSSSLDVEIRCSGVFDDTSFLTAAGLAAPEHGLRTCIGQLSRAAGVEAPLLSNTTELAGLRNFLAAAARGRFAIGQASGETVFFYSLPRSSQVEQFTGAAN